MLLRAKANSTTATTTVMQTPAKKSIPAAALPPPQSASKTNHSVAAVVRPSAIKKTVEVRKNPERTTKIHNDNVNSSLENRACFNEIIDPDDSDDIAVANNSNGSADNDEILHALGKRLNSELYQQGNHSEDQIGNVSGGSNSTYSSCSDLQVSSNRTVVAGANVNKRRKVVEESKNESILLFEQQLQAALETGEVKINNSLRQNRRYD